MAGEARMAAERLLAALDRSDVDAAIEMISSDAQGIDEVSRTWLRSRGALIAYVRQLVDTVHEMRSEMRDVHEVQWGDTGVVTFWLEQDYTFEGTPHHVSAPTTYVLRREGGTWKLVLGHSIPVP